jgi:hypothetical protein
MNFHQNKEKQNQAFLHPKKRFLPLILMLIPHAVIAVRPLRGVQDPTLGVHRRPLVVFLPERSRFPQVMRPHLGENQFHPGTRADISLRHLRRGKPLIVRRVPLELPKARDRIPLAQ